MGRSSGLLIQDNTGYLKLILLISLLFLYLYGINFSFLPMHTSRLIAFLSLPFLVFSVILRNYIIFIPKRLLLVGFFYFLLLLWVVFTTGVYGFLDDALLTGTLLILIQGVTGASLFSFLFYKVGLTFRDIIFLIQSAISIQAIFIVLYFISWDFREFAFHFIPESGNINYRENLFRSRGLMNSSGSTLSLMQSFGLLFTAYLIVTVKTYRKEFWYYVFSFGLIFLSIFLTGRSGLLMLPVAIFYMFFLNVANLSINKKSLVFVIMIPIVLGVSYFILRLGYQLILGGFETSWGGDGFQQLTNWVLNEFISSDGQIQSRTAQILANHWIFPENFLLTVFGDPTTWNVNRISSDIGYIRILHGLGLVGLLIFYLFFAVLFFVSVKSTKGLEAKVMISFFGLFLFVLEAKEPFLLNLKIGSFVVLILFISVVFRGSLSNISNLNK